MFMDGKLDANRMVRTRQGSPSGPSMASFMLKQKGKTRWASSLGIHDGRPGLIQIKAQGPPCAMEKNRQSLLSYKKKPHLDV